MQTLIRAWKRRVALKVQAQAIADHSRLNREYCGPKTANARPSFLILAELYEANRRELRARRLILDLNAAAR